MTNSTLTPSEQIIHEASLVAGDRVAFTWADYKTTPNQTTKNDFDSALEAFIELRQQLPITEDGMHVGCGESYPRTQGIALNMA